MSGARANRPLHATHALAGANRIPLSTALRGTLATVVPLAVYPRAGLGDIAYPALLGALATSMVDVVGPYRTRLIAVLVQARGGVPWPSLESQLAELVSQLSSGDASETSAPRDYWLASLVM